MIVVVVAVVVVVVVRPVTRPDGTRNFQVIVQ